jgi:drug/metabolite transporter (DMT)-like permease
VLAWCRLRGVRLAFGAREHALFALQGVFMYSLSYLCVYHAERHVASGLVAVGYSASPLINGVAAHWLWGVPLTRRFLAGGVIGIAGVALIFGPELARAETGAATALGAGFTAASVLLSSVGSLTGEPQWRARPAAVAGAGFGMLYSAASSALALALAISLTPGLSAAAALPPATPSWWLALLYLQWPARCWPSAPG